MRPATLLVPLLPFLPLALGGLFTADRGVLLKSIKGLKAHLKSTEKASMVSFTAPWCGHCKSLKPEYDRAAENVKNLVHFVNVDCDAEENKAGCSEAGVKGFPTLKYYPGIPQARDYQGPRTAKGMVDFALEGMPTFARKVKKDAELEKLISKATPERPLSVLFTKAKLTTPMYKALSSEFRKSMDVYTANEAIMSPATLSKYSVTSVPALVVFSGPDAHEKFEGQLKYENISGFLKKFGSNAKAGKAKGEL